MKLLRCKKCEDVIALILSDTRSCHCGSTKGKYVDYLNAVYSGDEAVPLGFDNASFQSAIDRQPESGWGPDFSAFVIARRCPTFVRVDVPPPPHGVTELTQKMAEATTDAEATVIRDEVMKSSKPKRPKKK